MSSLADELAADLLSSGGESDAEPDQERPTLEYGSRQTLNDADSKSVSAETQSTNAHNDKDAWRSQRIDQVARRVRSSAWTSTMNEIERHIQDGDAAVARPSNNDTSDGMRWKSMATDSDDEYQTIVKANSMAQEMDDEMRIVVKYIRDRYSKRFPELEGLVQNPLDYAKTVKAIGNNLDLTKLNLTLPSATKMVIVVAASDSKGEPLTQRELDCVLEGCETVFLLEKMRTVVFDYVRSRISLIAPNLAALIGTTTAANLIGFAGGLFGLSKIPACNLAALGAKRQSGIGLSSGIGVRNQGYLYESNLVRNASPDVRTQVQRIVAAKVSLAARIDAVRESTDGSMGQKLLEQINEKIEKLQEPPARTEKRALPRPDDKPKKRRGGRRIQKAKGQYAITELRKQQNRMAFGVQEEEVGFGDETEGLGMLGTVSGGSLRAATIDQRTKLKLSKNRKLQLERMMGQQQQERLPGSSASSALGGIQTSGLMSSLNFSSKQGLELVNPLANKQSGTETKDKWFNSGIFSQIKKD